METRTDAPAPRAAALSGLALVAAATVLALFAALVVFLITETDAGEPRWSRLAWIFGSVEAIAFGAAGALFGASIQRARAERAEKEASKGRALAETLKADDPAAAPAGQRGLESLGTERSDAAAEVAARHAELARRYFPD